MKGQRGIGLPEILIALLSSSLLMTVLMSQYVSIKQHYKRSEVLLETELDTQMVSDFIRDTVRKAGFTPCLSLERLITMDTRHEKRPLSSIDIQLNQGHGFQINHMADHYGVLVHQVSPTELIVSNDAVLSVHQPVVISDCYHAEVHQISALYAVPGGQEIQLEKALAFSYEEAMYVGGWLEEQFFARQGTLFYSAGHVDALSSSVCDISAGLKTNQRKRLFNVVLTFAKGRALPLDIMIRTPS